VAVVEGAVVYIIGLWVLRVPELDVAVGVVRRVLRRPRSSSA
jgi:uncharacterized membrane protein YiaA